MPRTTQRRPARRRSVRAAGTERTLRLILLIALVLLVVATLRDGLTSMPGLFGAATNPARTGVEAARASTESARASTAWAEARVANAWAEAEARRAQAWADQQAARAALATIGLAAAGALLLILGWGGGRALVDLLHLRARLIAPRGGLYPAVHGHQPVTHLNEPGAQIARLAPPPAHALSAPPAQVLPAVPLHPSIPEPVIITAERLPHLERLLLAAGGQHDVDHDSAS